MEKHLPSEKGVNSAGIWGLLKLLNNVLSAKGYRIVKYGSCPWRLKHLSNNMRLWVKTSDVLIVQRRLSSLWARVGRKWLHRWDEISVGFLGMRIWSWSLRGDLRQKKQNWPKKTQLSTVYTACSDRDPLGPFPHSASWFPFYFQKLRISPLCRYACICALQASVVLKKWKFCDSTPNNIWVWTLPAVTVIRPSLPQGIAYQLTPVDTTVLRATSPEFLFTSFVISVTISNSEELMPLKSWKLFVRPPGFSIFALFCVCSEKIIHSYDPKPKRYKKVKNLSTILSFSVVNSFIG